MLTIIENVHLYQPEDKGINDIVLCGAKIVDIGRDLAVSYPLAKRINATGLLATPGYIDQHVHIIGGGGKGSFRTRIPELQLSSCISGGVTTLVGLMGTDGITKSVENLVAKTKALNEEGITAYCLTGSYEYPCITLTGNLKKDIVFIQEIIGVKIAISDHRSSNPTKQELIRLISDVRLAALMSGKPGIVTIHVGRGKGKMDVLFEILSETNLPIKHLRPTHLGNHREQAVKFAVMGGYIDFTASNNPSEVATDITKALGNGAPLKLVTLSSDSNGSFPNEVENIGIKAASMDSLHNVIKTLIQEQKMSISSAISLVTSNVAEALDLSDHKGRLLPGCDADILLLEEDLRINTVIAQGRILMQSGEIKVKGTFE